MFSHRFSLIRASMAACALSPLVLITNTANAQLFNVPGTSDPWLAGMPTGSTASGGDVAPNQSPRLASGLTLTPGSALTFTVTGSVNFVPAPSGNSPDGDSGFVINHSAGTENGIADVTMPVNALVGIFLNNNQPDLTSAPGTLDFSTGGLGTNFASLSPDLKQPFFIGDGLTGDGTGSTQQFIIPLGATRLFIGTMDGTEWSNNFGSFDVVVSGGSPAAVPEPGTIASLLASGLTGGGLFLRHRRR